MNNQAKTGEIVRLEINHGTNGQVQCKAIRRNGPNRRPSRPVILIPEYDATPKSKVYRHRDDAAKALGCSSATVQNTCNEKGERYGYRIRWASHTQAMRLEHAISTPDATPTPQDHPAYIPPTQATWVGVLRTAKESTAEADRLKARHTENLDTLGAQARTISLLKMNLDDVERNKAATHRAHASEIQSLKQAAADLSPAVCPVSLEALSAVSGLLAELATPIAASVVRDALEGHLSKLLGDMGLRLEPPALGATPLSLKTPDALDWRGVTAGQWYDIEGDTEDYWRFVDDDGDNNDIFKERPATGTTETSPHTAKRAMELGL